MVDSEDINLEKGVVCYLLLGYVAAAKSYLSADCILLFVYPALYEDELGLYISLPCNHRKSPTAIAYSDKIDGGNLSTNLNSFRNADYLGTIVYLYLASLDFHVELLIFGQPFFNFIILSWRQPGCLQSPFVYFYFQ